MPSDIDLALRRGLAVVGEGGQALVNIVCGRARE